MAQPTPEVLSAIFVAIERQARDRLTVLGICGAQGSGKTTLGRAIVRACSDRGIAAAALSLDDFYLTRADRSILAREVHPLLATRGVPGTHDIALALDVLAALDRGEPAALPRFSKADDDRAPAADWGLAPPDCRLLVFEGWCVGARPERDEALRDPVNALERDEDGDGIWRRFANAQLAGPYQALFARIDVLALVAAPAFETVLDWRLEQEADLAANAPAGSPGLMDGPDVARFVAHYERLTRHILSEMPARADLVIRLGTDRHPLSIASKGQ